MKDPSDNKTGDMLEKKSKAQRFRDKQISSGLRQFSFWLTDVEAAKVKELVKSMRGE